MDTFSIIRDAIAASDGDTQKEGLHADVIEAGRVVGAVQSVVDALTPPDGGRYVVGFADISTAATSLAERRIVVSSKPLRDTSLSMVEKAVVIATFAAHEIGHTLVTRPRKSRIVEHNPKSGYHAVANLADDIILEPLMTDRYPILADAFAFTGLWVLRNTAKELPKVHRMRKDMTTAERFNVVLSATRYADTTDIVFADGVTIAERDWCRSWSDRLVALRLTDHDGFLAACDELWDHIRAEADEEEQPQPIVDEPEPEPTDEDGEDEDEDGEDEGPEPTDETGQPSDEDGEDEGPGGSQPTDEEGTDEDFEQSDDVDFGEDDADDGEDDGPTDDGDGEGKDESDGTDGDGESSDIADESDAEGEGKDGTDGELGDDAESDGGHGDDEDGEGGGGNPDLRNEDDFDKDEVESSMHDQSERPPYDYEADRADEQVRQFASTTSTAFGRHGRLITEWS